MYIIKFFYFLEKTNSIYIQQLKFYYAHRNMTIDKNRKVNKKKGNKKMCVNKL